MSLFTKHEEYDYIYQGWAIIAFTKDPEYQNGIMEADPYPYVCAVFDDRHIALDTARRMRYEGLKCGKDYHFIVQGVPINAIKPIIGLGKAVGTDGSLKHANTYGILV